MKPWATFTWKRATTKEALAYNTEAYEYDDEDSITLDNLGQTYYRLGNDKAKAANFSKGHRAQAHAD